MTSGQNMLPDCSGADESVAGSLDLLVMAVNDYACAQEGKNVGIAVV